MGFGMRWIAVILLASLSLCTFAQEPWTEGMLMLTGASSAEELDQDTVDSYEYFHHHPLHLNQDSPRRLSRLLSAYQIASLKDYRQRCGDVLSLQELALVDGFGETRARALAYFVSFESARAPGEAVKDSLRLRAAAQTRGDLNAIGGKLRISGGNLFEAGAAYRQYWAGPRSGTFYAHVSPPRGASFIAGDFNLRYGEGLVFWSGMQISSFSTIGTYSRRGGGLSPSWSYTGSGTFRGFAAEYGFGEGPFLSAMAFITADAAGGRLSAMSRSGTYGLNLKAGQGRVQISADVRQNIRGVDVFGEAALDPLRSAWAAVGGAKLSLSEGLQAALRLGAVPSRWSGKSSGEYSLDTGIQYTGGKYVPIAGKQGFGSTERRHTLDLTARLRLLPIPIKAPERREAKLQGAWAFRADSLLKLENRAVLRFRNYEPFRGEIRTDATISDNLVSLHSRLHGCWCGGPGGLAYTELGYTPGNWQIWLRGTVYATSGWSSRIYAYERDVAGSFSVPACYGAGNSLSLYGAFTRKFRYFRLKGALRAFIGTKKPGISAGLRFFLSVDL